MELDITWKRVLRVWWSYFWRSIISFAVCLFLAYGIGMAIGQVTVWLGLPMKIMMAVGRVIGGCLGIIMSIFPIWLILGRRMGNFRLVLMADDSPMTEGVAQKGTGVRLIYFKRVCVILVGQAVMVAGAVYLDESRHGWMQGTCAFSSLVGPFIAYIVAFYDNPKLAMKSPALKTGILTISSIILTLIGFLILMFAGMHSNGEI